jgi:anti-sigma factor RsiW
MCATFLAQRNPIDRWCPCLTSVIEIDCQQVRRELSNYLEGDLAPELRLQIESHLASCSHCAAVHDGMRNVVRLLGDGKLLDVPEGFGKRLYQRLLSEAR